MPFREIDKNNQGLIGIGIDITEVCNRKCPTCFAANTPQNMDIDIYKEIIDEGERMKFPELYILGGEPTSHPRIIEYLEYAKNKFNLVILVTNMDRLANNEFCQLVHNTGVTIAGQRHTLNNDEKSHQLERILTGGEHLNTSHRAWDNVEKIFSPGRVCVQCCITQPVVSNGDIFEIFRWARSKKYEPVMEFTKEGVNFKRNCNLDVQPQNIIKIFKEFQRIDREEFNLPGAEMLLPQAYGKTCHMQETSIHFKVDGSSIPCVGFSSLNYGHIKDGLNSIIDNPLRYYISNPKEWIYGYCKTECQHFDCCTGGCRGSAFDMTGCYRASFYYCPHIPRKELSLKDMIPPSCINCPLEGNLTCNPKR